MIRKRLLSHFVVFLLGLCIGGLAFGYMVAYNDTPQHTVTQQPDPSEIPSSDKPTVQPILEPGLDATDHAEFRQQVTALLSRWTELESRLEQLDKRVISLETENTPELSQTNESSTGNESSISDATSPEDQKGYRKALIVAGVDEQTADDILWRQSELELKRLELRDRAIREEWFRSDRYFDELSQLNDAGLDLREEIGDTRYDQYLYQLGESNRVRVTSVIRGSAAEQSGIVSGDIIERYANQGILDASDLRTATTQGSRDELVPVTLRRKDLTIETWIARGPMGVRLEGATAVPSR